MGRPPIGKRAMTAAERQRKRREHIVTERPVTKQSASTVLLWVANGLIDYRFQASTPEGVYDIKPKFDVTRRKSTFVGNEVRFVTLWRDKPGGDCVEFAAEKYIRVIASGVKGEAAAKALAQADYDQHCERQRKNIVTERPVTKPVLAAADLLSMSAQQRLDTAIRQEKRRLDAEHAARMRAVDEEVRQRVVAEGKEYVAMVKEREAKVRSDEKLWREIINGHKPLFTVDQFKTILMCLHPDGVRTAEKLADAFRLFNGRKLQLTGKR